MIAAATATRVLGPPRSRHPLRGLDDPPQGHEQATAGVADALARASAARDASPSDTYVSAPKIVPRSLPRATSQEPATEDQDDRQPGRRPPRPRPDSGEAGERARRAGLRRRCARRPRCGDAPRRRMPRCRACWSPVRPRVRRFAPRRGWNRAGAPPLPKGGAEERRRPTSSGGRTTSSISGISVSRPSSAPAVTTRKFWRRAGSTRMPP